jgi:hypothetical protein
MIPSKGTKWGDMNLVDAERRLLATALLDLANTRFALFSESCIPLLGFPAVYTYLTSSNTSTIFVDNYPTSERHDPFFADHNISLSQWRKGSQWFEMAGPPQSKLSLRSGGMTCFGETTTCQTWWSTTCRRW